MSKIPLNNFLDNLTNFSNKENYLKKTTSGVYTCISDRLDILRCAVSNSVVSDHIDPIRRYLEYINCLILIYTNIDTSGEDIYYIYDSMQKNGILPLLLKEIGEDQIKEITMFYSMVTEEMLYQLEGAHHGNE